MSVYRCVLCLYCAEQRGATSSLMSTGFIWVCVFSATSVPTIHIASIDMKSHLSKAHPSQEDEWLKPLPNLEGLIGVRARR